MKTPVAFIIFNRPDTTERVFEVIRQAKPPKLLVVADGPRSDRPDEAKKCAATRAVINHVDWNCEVLTNYSDANLGCKHRVASGLDWVFSLVEEAIILEDDCLPHDSFFRFCEELLNYYRHNEQVMVISGDNFQFGHRRTEHSYYFSRYPHCWGWATWKRAWQYNDIEMKSWKRIRDSNFLNSILQDSHSVKHWTKVFEATLGEQRDIWDYCWALACWTQNGYTALPNVNLVSNIGFSAMATNTRGKSQFANLPVEAMQFPLTHPSHVIRNIQADEFTERSMFNISLLNRIKVKIRKVIGKNSGCQL